MTLGCQIALASFFPVHDLMNQIALIPTAGIPATSTPHSLPSGRERRRTWPTALLPTRLPRGQWMLAQLATAALQTYRTLGPEGASRAREITMWLASH